MAKTKKGKGKGAKERITPPSKAELKQAAKDLRSGDRAGARAMADASVAKRQKVKRPKKP